jgi:hypothetical protein
MATRVTLVCDVCERATTDEHRYQIRWNGQEVEIDLCTVHEKPLKSLLGSTNAAPTLVGRSATLDAAKRVTSRKAKKAPPTKKSPAKRRVSTPPDSRAVRAWAEANGVEVNAKGRVPDAVILQFQEAGN